MRKKHFLIFLSMLFLFSAPLRLFGDPIDIVYTWVDDQDPNWQEIRAIWAKQHEIKNRDANTNCRFRNRDELKYSLRSVLAYVPFVHHIYIITFGQRPKWLEDSPLITIVDHSEIFKNPSDLPTFNSQAIETNLHRIPNLSEKFIYVNDDVFFNRLVKEENFFFENGIVVNSTGSLSPSGPHKKNESAYTSAWKNTNLLLNKSFKKEKRSTLSHAPFALRKSIMEAAEQQFQDIFSQVSQHKFRMPEDYVITNGLVQYCALYTGHAQFEEQGTVLAHISDDMVKNEVYFDEIREQNIPFFCIADGLKDDSFLVKEVNEQLRDFLEEHFPNPAPWEKAVIPSE